MNTKHVKFQCKEHLEFTTNSKAEFLKHLAEDKKVEQEAIQTLEFEAEIRVQEEILKQEAAMKAEQEAIQEADAIEEHEAREKYFDSMGRENTQDHINKDLLLV